MAQANLPDPPRRSELALMYVLNSRPIVLEVPSLLVTWWHRLGGVVDRPLFKRVVVSPDHILCRKLAPSVVPLNALPDGEGYLAQVLCNPPRLSHLRDIYLLRRYHAGFCQL